MISTKFLVQTWRDIPETWIFEYFCKLDVKLEGQDLKFKSIFNPTEKTPSMCLFFSKDKQRYLFKDFSTGKSGTAMKLVQELFQEDFSHTCSRVISTYNDFVLLNNGVEHKITDFKVRSKYKVTEVQERQWNQGDKSYWQQYFLPSQMLERYCIRPLESYKMSKEDDGETSSLEIRGPFLYGFFQKDGTLYKIYQPKNKQYKFIKVKDYRMGSEQLEGKPMLIICSSLKDGMVIRSLCPNTDIVIPDSENTMMKEYEILEYRKRYKHVFTLFDNDSAGIEAMKKYKKHFDLDYLYFDAEKDIAEAIKVNGVKKTKEKLLILITKKLNP